MSREPEIESRLCQIASNVAIRFRIQRRKSYRLCGLEAHEGERNGHELGSPTILLAGDGFDTDAAFDSVFAPISSGADRVRAVRDHGVRHPWSGH